MTKTNVTLSVSYGDAGFEFSEDIENVYPSERVRVVFEMLDRFQLMLAAAHPGEYQEHKESF